MDAPDAVSSTAEPGTSSALIASLSQEDRTTWRMTGSLPTTTQDVSSSVPAESDPAVPAVQADATASTPQAAPEPADDLKPKTKARIDALLADRKAAQDRADALARELAALKAPTPASVAVKSADSAPATGTREDAQRFAPDTTQPALTDVEFVERFPEATYGDYSRYVVRYELAADRAVAQQTSTLTSRRDAFRAQLADAMKTEPGFLTSLDPRVAQAVPLDALGPGETPTALNRIAQEVFVSPQAVALLRHLSTHPAELDRIAALSPDGIVRAMARLEGVLDGATVAKPESTPPLVSKGPALDTLGRKPAVDSDPVAAALARGDFRGYREAVNAREMAASGR